MTDSNGRWPGIRVCRLVADYPVGGKPSYGLQPVFHYLSVEQARRGHEVHVVARRKSGQPAEEEFERIQIHRVEDPFTLNAYRTLRGLARGSAGNRPTVVHTHATSGLFLAALKRTIKAPVVSHVHGTSKSPYMPVVLKYGSIELGYSPVNVAISYSREKALWSSADRVLAVSSSVKEDLVEYYNLRPDKVRVVYNGADTAIFRPGVEMKKDGPLEGRLDGKKVVLYVGHFGLRKGLFYLIKSMPQVIKAIPNAVLVCVGGVPEWLGARGFWELLNTFIDQNGLRDRVFLLDKIPNGDLPAYYCRSSVVVLPSYYEAFAKVIIEGMACGVPVISSRMGGALDAIDSEKTGYLVEYGNTTEISDAIIRVLGDERGARQMGVLARRRVLENFTWEAVANRIDSVYADALDGGGSPLHHHSPSDSISGVAVTQSSRTLRRLRSG